MATPFSVQWSKLPFPHEISGHVAVTWKDTVIVWGGNIPHNVVVQCVAAGEWVTGETSGEVPDESQLGGKPHVVNDKMFLLRRGDIARNVIHALDLNTLVWEALVPRNTLSIVSDGFTSWLHGGKIYVFGGGCSNQGCIGMGGGCGGASNLLYCYNSMNNTWEWPLHGGEVPSPREDMDTIIVDDTVYLFGGNRYFQIEDMKYNDLYILDMRSMLWKRVHGNCYQGEAPHAKLSPDHTLTMISKSAGVLYGALVDYFNDEYSPECWLLNLDNVRQLKDPASIWTRIPTPFPREVHASVLEPVSQSLWVIGGEDNSSHASDGFISDVLKMSCNVVPLKTLAMDHIARNISTNDPRLSYENYPIELGNEIEEHRSSIEEFAEP